MPTKTIGAKKLDPNAAAIARAIALENRAAPRSAFGLDTAQGNLDQATAGYRAKYLTSFDIPGRVTEYAKTVAPDVASTSADMEKGYGVDPNSPDYVDPSNIVSLVRQRMQGGRDYLSRVSGAVGNLYDKGVQSSRFGVEDATNQLDRASQQYSDRLGRARALLDEQRQREQGLQDYERKAQIDRRYSSSGGGAGNAITLQEALGKPGSLGLYAAGVSKVQKADGGFDFIDNKTGKPMKVEDVQARIPGSSILDFIEGSTNSQDTARLNPPTQQQPDAAEAFRSDLVNARTALTSGAKKRDIQNRLLNAYPDKRKEILEALR